VLVKARVEQRFAGLLRIREDFLNLTLLVGDAADLFSSGVAISMDHKKSDVDLSARCLNPFA